MNDFTLLLRRAAFLALMIGIVNGCYSQYGLLDVSFGNNGKVIIPQPVPNHYGMQANEVAVQPDGKILIAASSYYDLSVDDSSRFILMRYNVDGSPDASFGIGGIVITDINHQSDISVTLALQPDGKIIAAGSTRFNRYYNDWAMVRYNVNGSVDSSFGVNGIVKVSRSANAEYIRTILIKPDGKIIAAGHIHVGVQTEMVQFMPDGTVDSSFGTNGVASLTPIMSVAKLVMQPDGKILAAGTVPDTDTMLVVRLHPTGRIDSSFGHAGKAYVLFNYGTINSLSLQSDGKMILIGRASNLFNNNTESAMARLNSDGMPDSTFGINGKVFSLGGIDQGYRVMVRPDGKLLVTASKDKGFSYFPPVYGNFALLKYNSNGTLDSAFGRHGVIFTDFAGKNDEAYCSALQADGKIIIAGFTVQNGKNAIALARYESVGLTYYNTITASVFYDNNINGIKEAGEPYFSQADVTTLKPGADTIHMTTNGKYSVEVDSGTYTTLVKPYFSYFNIVPASHLTSNAGYFNYDTIAFAVQPVSGKRDLSIQVIPTGFPRPGFPIQYKIFVRNNGTDTIPDDTIQFVKSNKLIFNRSFPMPDSINGDTLRWSFSDFKPLDTTGIMVYLTIKAPPVVNIGDTLTSVAKLDSSATELTPVNNISEIVQIARGALDPNLKTENHGGKITANQVVNGEYLQYTIMFQNTGTDTAFNVYIHDTLSDKLDWNTLQMVTASHNYQFSMNDGKCLWTFNDIKLVDSNRNEPASHGYVVYKVKLKPAVVTGDVITNIAAIYFDYNKPVYTNNETTRVVSETLPLKLLAFSATRQYKANLLHWSTAQEINVDHFEIERSINGKEFSKIANVKSGLANYIFIEDNPYKAINYYRLKMVDKDSKFEYSPVRTVNNSGSYAITIYPNPAKDQLQMQVNSDKKTTLYTQVLSPEGKILLANIFRINEGSGLRSVNISLLPRGTYFLKATSPENEESFIKFVKM